MTPRKKENIKYMNLIVQKRLVETLKIPIQTLYSIIKGRIKYKHKSIEHVKNIIIKKQVIEPKRKKPLKTRGKKDSKQFEKELIEKLG